MKQSKSKKSRISKLINKSIDKKLKELKNGKTNTKKMY